MFRDQDSGIQESWGVPPMAALVLNKRAATFPDP